MDGVDGEVKLGLEVPYCLRSWRVSCMEAWGTDAVMATELKVILIQSSFVVGGVAFSVASSSPNWLRRSESRWAE
jgi:hypothetical protein